MNPSVAMPLIIDRMKCHEAEQLNSLFTRVVNALPFYNETAISSELEKYSPTRLRESISNDQDSVLIAKTGEEVIGFCLSHYDDGLIWLSWFGVNPLYRRRGIGSALLERLEETVRNRKAHKVWCDSRTENEASRLVLISHGYTQLCTVRNHWYGQDFILWEKLVR